MEYKGAVTSVGLSDIGLERIIGPFKLLGWVLRCKSFQSGFSEAGEVLRLRLVRFRAEKSDTLIRNTLVLGVFSSIPSHGEHQSPEDYDPTYCIFYLSFPIFNFFELCFFLFSFTNLFLLPLTRT